MTHGFGVSQDDMKALEFKVIAAAKGYDTELMNNIVAITDNTGLSVSVRVANGKYCMKVRRSEICYAKPMTVIKHIPKSFEQKKHERNGMYS